MAVINFGFGGDMNNLKKFGIPAEVVIPCNNIPKVFQNMLNDLAEDLGEEFRTEPEDVPVRQMEAPVNEMCAASLQAISDMLDSLIDSPLIASAYCAMQGCSGEDRDFGTLYSFENHLQDAKRDLMYLLDRVQGHENVVHSFYGDDFESEEDISDVPEFLPNRGSFRTIEEFKSWLESQMDEAGVYTEFHEDDEDVDDNPTSQKFAPTLIPRSDFDIIEEYQRFRQDAVTLYHLAKEKGVDFKDDSITPLIDLAWIKHCLARYSYDKALELDIARELNFIPAPYDFIYGIAKKYIEDNVLEEEVTMGLGDYFTEEELDQLEYLYGVVDDNTYDSVDGYFTEKELDDLEYLYGVIPNDEIDPEDIHFNGSVVYF